MSKAKMRLGEVEEHSGKTPRVFLQAVQERCARTKDPVACLMKQERFQKTEPQGFKHGASTSPDIVLQSATELATARAGKRDPILDLIPGAGTIKRCPLPKGKDGLRENHTELTFLNEAYAKKHGVAPGVYLRVCVQPKEPGYLIPVNSARQSIEVAGQYADCVRKNQADVIKKCMRTMNGGKEPALGALRRRR